MIYISGQIDGLDLQEAILRFMDAVIQLDNSVNPLFEAEKLELRIKGNTKEFPSLKYETYLANSILMLLKCEEIYMLKGWENSKGARLELEIAKLKGMKIRYED